MAEALAEVRALRLFAHRTELALAQDLLDPATPGRSVPLARIQLGLRTTSVVGSTLTGMRLTLSRPRWWVSVGCAMARCRSCRACWHRFAWLQVPAIERFCAAMLWQDAASVGGMGCIPGVY